MFLAQIVGQSSQSSLNSNNSFGGKSNFQLSYLVVAAHAVEICDGLGVHVHGREAPVHAEVDRDQHQAVGEEVHLLGPPPHRAVPGVHQTRVEEGGEGVHWPEVLLVSLRSEMHVN